MTISTQTTKVVALGNGVTTVFDYNFLIPAASDVEVIYTDLSGTNTTLTPSDYSITGLNNPLGGTVTYPLSGSPIAAGTSLTIARQLPLVQLTTISNQGGFYPQAVDQALDYLTMLVQQVNELFSRALVAPIEDPDAPLPLPPVAARASQLLGFDGDGNPIASQPSSALVSSAMQPVVSAATLAIARTALGLGTMATEGIGAGLADDGSGNVEVLFGQTSVSTNTAITSAHYLKHLIVTGPVTLTLPRANTLFSDFGFWVFAFTGTVTVAVNAADSFKGQASGASIGIPAGWVAYITTNAANTGIWYINASLPALPLQAPQSGQSFSNLVIQNNSGTPDKKLDVTADELVLSGTGTQVRLTSFSGTVDGTTVGVVNGLDTGSLQANTWYYLYGIAGVGLTGIVSSGLLLSASATAPTMPSGYTFKKLLGGFRTNSSINFYRTIQRGRSAQYLIGSNPTTVRIAASGVLGSISTPTWSAVAISTYVPTAIASRIMGYLQIGAATEGVGAMLAPSNTYGAYTSTTNRPPVVNSTQAGDDNITWATPFNFVIETTNIYYAANDATGAVAITGWELNI